MTATLAKLNFVLTGEAGAGASVIRSLLSAQEDVVCHDDLFDGDEAARRLAHEGYFGEDAWDSPPTWFVPGEISPTQYLNTTVFDSARRGETVVGVHLPYPVIQEFQLDDLLTNRYRAGDFCLVHVVRNPLACLAAAWQADTGRTLGLSLDPEEVTAYCRQSLATRARIRAACGDALELPYLDFVHQFRTTAAKLFDFLELDDSLVSIRHRPEPLVLRRCVSNFERLKARVAPDVRDLIVDDPA